MREADLEEIRKKAHDYQNEDVGWHFHILTPNCALNKKQKYAFVFECAQKHEYLVYYSNQAERGLGEELAPLMHGAKILEPEPADAEHKPSAEMQQIINRAKELNDKGIEWHHHVFNPQCQFNTHAPKFTFVFEDPETGEKIESLSDEEPTGDLKFIEKLFYRK
ncbi:MAG TPA: hypothetical protein VFW90_03270 [Candidatus Saccharimonadales bacterium]|nr:hypothetical protein [Candidatus Saccharimonadales bacterium]